ncbi:hypothetical protein C8R34_103117 [Nitrosomonas sp. Nm84]|nr:hypothetical protein C8R34_103117 [Nitrosomonas sp. Nm84]
MSEKIIMIASLKYNITKPELIDQPSLVAGFLLLIFSHPL